MLDDEFCRLHEGLGQQASLHSAPVNKKNK